MSYYESKVINSSNLLNDKLKFGELSVYVKRINVGMNMKDASKKILPMTIVSPYEKTKVLRLDHMSQHWVRHVPSHHNKRQPLICHHYGKYGHTRPYCLELLKLKIRGCKEVHARKSEHPMIQQLAL